jgi:branched-chain amino acid transport system permease protein
MSQNTSSPSGAKAMTAAAPLDAATLARHNAGVNRWRPWEWILWALVWAVPFVFPQHSALINEVAILALFALSLDLVLGYAGIVSLGHAAFFGLGAYGAALFAKSVMPDPLMGLAVATALGAVLGLITCPMIVRGTDLTRLMVTMGVALVLFELANKFSDITGGADGLQGVVMGPLLGRFEFDLGARTPRRCIRCRCCSSCSRCCGASCIHLSASRCGRCATTACAWPRWA